MSSPMRKRAPIEIDVSLVKDRLVTAVTNDGIGSAPERWVPGLGVGGVRKRVWQLGDNVTGGNIRRAAFAAASVWRACPPRIDRADHPNKQRPKRAVVMKNKWGG
jgi:hypothetical protein